MNAQRTITLCPACEACPTIESDGEVVRIGEEGNRVTLKKSEWNDIVDKIIRGELGKV